MRIEGVDLPRDKQVEISLTYLYGVGRTRSREILAAAGINPMTRVKDLTEAEIGAIRDYVGSHFRVEGELRQPRREIALPGHQVPFAVLVAEQAGADRLEDRLDEIPCGHTRHPQKRARIRRRPPGNNHAVPAD